jgi:hypothetical protein
VLPTDGGRLTKKVVRVISDEEAKNLKQVADEIKSLVQGLRDDMAKAAVMRDELASLTRSGKVTRLIVVAVSIIIVFMLALGTVQAVTLSRLDDVVRVQHDSALCPLYQIFINADTPAARDAAAKRGDDMAQRDRAFDTIRQSYTALNCQAK